jgi:hypothetical protein
MTNFEERRSNILSVFQKAKEDLEALNKDINDRINENTQTISNLNDENSKLKSLILQNEQSANIFKKILKL